jgi:hypothetical protein
MAGKILNGLFMAGKDLSGYPFPGQILLDAPARRG